MSGKLQLEVSSADIRRLLRNGDLPWIRRVVFVGDFAEASVATAAFGSCLWLAHSAISEVTVAPQPPLADIQRYVAVS